MNNTISLKDIEDAYIKERERMSLADRILEDYVDKHQDEFIEYLKKYFYEE